MAKVKKKRVRELADALESGEYSQGRGVLRQGSDFCCLGVACELFRLATRNGEWDGRDVYDVFGIHGETRADYLPEAVRDFYGFGGCNPEIAIQGITRPAGYFNDSGCTFSEIADGFRALAR